VPPSVSTTVMVLAAPVAVPDNTSRAPSVAVMTLALTPGLLGAALIAAAIPASVSLDESMLIEVEEPPTVIDRVPVPTTASAPAATGAEVSVCDVARFCTASEYCPATALEVVLAEAMLGSATVASKPAS